MIAPHIWRQRAVGKAIERGRYEAASEIMQIPLDRFRAGIPNPVWDMITGYKPPNRQKPL